MAPESPPEHAASPTPSPASRRDQRIESRLRAAVDTDDNLVAWTRGWISRELRLHRLLAARTFDCAVVTDRSLLLFSIGFFTRHPRRRVYSASLDAISVIDDDVSSGRRLRVHAGDSRALWIELNATSRSVEFADLLVARTRSAQP